MSILHRPALLRRAAFALLAFACLAAPARAHDIPTDVRLNAFFKPAGKTAELLVRLPLASLLDAELPLRNGAFLDVARADQAIRDGVKVWLTDNIDVFESGALLAKPRVAAAMVSLPSDQSFGAFDTARAHTLGAPLDGSLDVYASQMLVDVLLDYAIQSDAARFALDLRVDRLGGGVTTGLRFMPPDGATRAFEFHGSPGLVEMDPRWSQALLRFIQQGFWHILGGTDHLLFLACLVIPLRRIRPLIAVVTSFTIAHSITLAGSAFGFAPEFAWFPPLVEALIAATIVFMAIENIAGFQPGRRWIYAFFFGLIHGYGFSFDLREQLQFAGGHLVTSLLGFNIGVEIGQLAALLVMAPALALLFKYVFEERMGIIILSALVAHTGWHWMEERAAVVAKFPYPQIDAAFLASVLRGMMALAILGALVWLASGLVQKFAWGEKEPAQ